MRSISAAALYVVLVAAVARAGTPAECEAPAAMPDGWPVSRPVQQGLDPNLVCAIGPGLANRTEAIPHGVVVVRHGSVVYEQYFRSEDMHGNVVSYNVNTLHDVASITKGVVALLIGIAFDRGWLSDLDAPVVSFFPEYADLRTSEKDRITLRHLLAMTSGLDWPERAISLDDSANVVRQGASSADPYRFVLARRIETTPGTEWNYNSGGVWLLGSILRSVSRQPIEEFAKEALLEPLEIQDELWGRFRNGDPITSGGLRLRPRDLAKFGQLVLNGGIWHGRRIVSASWIKQMIAPHNPGDWKFGFARSYGYLWWQGESLIGDHDIEWVGALGRGGQRLYAVPALDLVVAVTAGQYIAKGGSPTVESRAGLTALNSFVLPAALGPR